MKVETLRPIVDRKMYSDAVAKKLEFELYVNIFKPVLDIFGMTLGQVKYGLFKNANISSFISGLERGMVAIKDGYVIGRFTSEVSKEIKGMGGVWDKRKKAWKLDSEHLDISTKQKIQSAQASNLDKVNKAIDKLAIIQKEGIPDLDLSGISDAILDNLGEQFKQTASTKLEVPMAYSGFIADELKEGYTENLNLHIKEWANEGIVRLKRQIQENSERGFRAETMRETIQAEYGVSRRKAKFLARQETSLMVSKYREATYKEAGVPAYMWSTSHDSRVRQDHRDLNGKIFRWDSPPVVDTHTGRRANPGEDFGCRCIAVPVLASQLAIGESLSLQRGEAE